MNKKPQQKVLYSWSAPSFSPYPKHKYWYEVAFVIALILMFWSIYDHNYAFSIIIGGLTAAYYLYQGDHQSDMHTQLTEDYLSFHGHIIKYREIKYFFQIEKLDNNPYNILYVHLREYKIWNQIRILVPKEVDIEELAQLLQDKGIKKKTHREPLIDKLAAWLRL